MGGDQQAPSVARKLVAALDRLARAQRHQRQAAASRLGVTPLQADLLRTVAEGPPPDALVGPLALELGVSQPTVTDSLAALERKGLVRRVPAPSDRRRRRLELTVEGRAMVAALARAEDEVVATVSGLPEGQQTSTYVALLGLIQRFVEHGSIEVARTCLTCRYMAETSGAGRHCLLLDMALPDEALRVNCPDHEAVA